MGTTVVQGAKASSGEGKQGVVKVKEMQVICCFNTTSFGAPHNKASSYPVSGSLIVKDHKNARSWGGEMGEGNQAHAQTKCNGSGGGG